MDDPADGEPLEVRAPTIDDVVRIVGSLERHGARYVLIGGFAVVAHGLQRTTKDIDLLVDPSPANVERLIEALAILEDGAARDIDPTDLETYSVVRVADEVMVDLLAAACGVTWSEAEASAVEMTIRDQRVLVASAATLVETKRTARPSDAADRAFLESLRE